MDELDAESTREDLEKDLCAAAATLATLGDDRRAELEAREARRNAATKAWQTVVDAHDVLSNEKSRSDVDRKASAEAVGNALGTLGGVAFIGLQNMGKMAAGAVGAAVEAGASAVGRLRTIASLCANASGTAPPVYRGDGVGGGTFAYPTSTPPRRWRRVAVTPSRDESGATAHEGGHPEETIVYQLVERPREVVRPREDDVVVAFPVNGVVADVVRQQPSRVAVARRYIPDIFDAVEPF